MIARPANSQVQHYQMVNRMRLGFIVRILNNGSRGFCGSWSRAGLLLALSLPATVMPGTSAAEAAEERPADSARFYRSLEERRAAGQGYEITDWLTLSGLLETEAGHTRDKIRNGAPDRREDKFITTVQLGLELGISESFSAELLFESEWDDGQRSVLDEAFLAIEDGRWNLEAGRLYLPFGRFYSNFITGPLLEFGETRGTALTTVYSLNERVKYGLFILDGETETRKKESDRLNWGLSVDFEFWNRAVRAGTSYLSDLAESQEISRFDFANSERNRVGGLSGYMLIGDGSLELSAEFMRSLRAFSAFEADANRPAAWNVELAYAPRTSLLFAIRFEGSSELHEEPENQVGVSATWRINRYSSISAEYLFGRYKDGFVLDDDGNPLGTRRQFGAQIAVEF